MVRTRTVRFTATLRDHCYRQIQKSRPPLLFDALHNSDVDKVCDACGSSDHRSYSYRGASNLMADFSHTAYGENYFFLMCSACGLGINESFDSTTAESGGSPYYNPTLWLDEGPWDWVVLEALRAGLKIQANNYPQSGPGRALEIGSGARLKLIDMTSSVLGMQACAVDRVYENADLVNRLQGDLAVSLLDSFEALPPDFRARLVIARNSLEYFSVTELRNLLGHLLKHPALLMVEFTPFPDADIHGSLTAFTEYRTFLSVQSLESILNAIGIDNHRLFHYRLEGDLREVVVVNCMGTNSPHGVVRCRTVKEFTRVLREASRLQRIVLWGSGGRSLMFMLNEGRGLVDSVVDTDPLRRGITLPDGIPIATPDSLRPGDVVAFFNPRAWSEIMGSATAGSLEHVVVFEP